MYEYEGLDDFIVNPAPRIPICLCIDSSGSMENSRDGGNKTRIERVQDGIMAFYGQLQDISDSAEIMVLGFCAEPYVVQDFETISKMDTKHELAFKPEKEMQHTGNMGKAVKKAIEELNKRKNIYKGAGVEYYQPWLIVMSDGHPTGQGCNMDLQEAQQETRKLVAEKKLTVITVFVGDSYKNLNELEEKDRRSYKAFNGLSDNENLPLLLTSDTDFSRFFVWLGKSVSNGSDVALDFAEFTDWENM